MGRIQYREGGARDSGQWGGEKAGEPGMGLHWLGCVKVEMQIREHHQTALAGNSGVPGLRCKNSKDCGKSELEASLEAIE